MTPTRLHIEAAYTYALGADRCDPDTLAFMRDAALAAIDAQPFRPGDIVVCAGDLIEIMVSDDPTSKETEFCGLVIKKGMYNVGHYSRQWQRESFTRKTTQP